MTTRRTLVMIATYNERESLPALVEAVFEHAAAADLLVIDDASPDGTGAWCDARAAEDPRVRCLHRAGKLGLGSAVVAGMRHAIEHGYDRLVTMDADYSHDPRHLPSLLAMLDRDVSPPVDMAIGSRYVAGGAICGWPLVRHFMSRAVNLYTRLLLGIKTRDCSGGYRAFRVARLAELDFDRMWARGYSFQEELLWRLIARGARVEETPITFVDRRQGLSKINLREAATAIWVIFRLAWERWLWKNNRK